MEDEEQTLVPLQSLAMNLLQLNHAISKVGQTYLKRRRDILQGFITSETTRCRRPHIQRRFWIMPGRSSAWWDSFMDQTVTAEEWHKNFRMSRSSLINICERLRPYLEGQTTVMRKPISVITKVAMTLHYLRDEEKLRKTADAFGVSLSAVSLIVRQVCKAISTTLGPEYIRTPTTESEVQELVANFYKSHGMPQCLGAIDCTHIELKQPPGDYTQFINGKENVSLNVQALCDYRYCFMDVLVESPGSVHDARIFAKSALCGDLRDGTIPTCPKELVKGEDHVPVFVVGDPAYRLTPFLMKEYPDGGVTLGEQNYGRAICKAHGVIERAFGRLKGRFGVLKGRMDINLKDLYFVIYACFVLHNYCEMQGEPMDEVDVNAAVQYDRNFQPQSTALRTDEDEEEGERVRRVVTKFLEP